MTSLPLYEFQIGENPYLWISILLFSILMGGLVVYSFFDRRYFRKNYEVQISLLEARSLQAQMNPHFIFNVLNGIQSVLILKTEKEISNYMGNLSNLLRMTLDLSKREAINLREEISYLKAYIELQRIRLNNYLDYCFDLHVDVEANRFFIPPLLIQPIVENSIIHGIVPSKTKGILVISFKVIDIGLRITVEDNGIGVSASKKLQKKRGANHQSLGNKILRERIDILNTDQRNKIQFKIANLKKIGVVSGTCATLDIPFDISKKLSEGSLSKYLAYEKD